MGSEYLESLLTRIDANLLLIVGSFDLGIENLQMI